MHVIQLMVDVGKYDAALERLRKDVETKILPLTSDVMNLEGEDGWRERTVRQR
jgi:hypothetical protein